MKFTREKDDSFVKALILFTSGILAHILAGGDVVSLYRLSVLSALIVITLFLTRRHILEGPQLAMLVLTLQSAGHFILGMADRSSEVQMIGAHIAAGILSYKTVTNFDKFKEFFANFVDAIHIPDFLAFELKISFPDLPIFRNQSFESKANLKSTLNRGPPLEI